MRFESQLLRGHLPTILLAVLERGPLYGYRIAEAVESGSKGLLQIGEGTIYPALYALEAKGLVRARWQASSAGPPRRYYELTARGSKVLARERETWERFSGALESILQPRGSPA